MAAQAELPLRYESLREKGSWPCSQKTTTSPRLKQVQFWKLFYAIASDAKQDYDTTGYAASRELRSPKAHRFRSSMPVWSMHKSARQHPHSHPPQEVRVCGEPELQRASRRWRSFWKFSRGRPAFQGGCLTKRLWKGIDIPWDAKGRICSDSERKNQLHSWSYMMILAVAYYNLQAADPFFQ